MTFRYHRFPWRSGSLALLAAATLYIPTGYASPSVNVALTASFNTAPYLVELLETAAEENSTSYFPLLDRIAEGTFAEITTEKDIYERFTQLLQDDGHLTNSESISSFKFALSIRSTAPRIEAHYQYYNTSVEPSLMVAQDAVCIVWAHYDGDQYCSPSLEYAQQSVTRDPHDRVMPFDRVLGDSSLPPLVLYADIASPLFGGFHQELIQKAREGQFSYRVRYRPSGHGTSRPLFVNAYGVELALKRTDYIVIDDRDAEQRVLKDADSTNPMLTPVDDLAKEPPADLKPLSASEVSVLGMNAASFVMSSDDPFATLLQLSQDFPRHSSSIASRNATPEFTQEFEANRATLLPAGYNVMWINGVQMEPHTINAFSLLDHFRHERKLINKLRDFGLSARQAVNLLSDPTVAKIQAADNSPRYDYRDELEGRGVIIWLNDLEKDHRYDGWSRDLRSLLKPTFHGQLPPVRRDVHNAVIPVDLSSSVDVAIVVESLQMLVKRRIPVRFGIVPLVHNSNALEQAKISHHLLDTYGIGTLIAYLQASLSAGKVSSPNQASFAAALENRKVREDRTALAFEDVLKSETYDPVLSNTKTYLQRLAVEGEETPFFVNGVSLMRDETFLQHMVETVSKDLEDIQRLVYEGALEEDIWIPSHFLQGALQFRNPLLIPQDPRQIRTVDLNEIHVKHQGVFDSVLRIPAAAESEHPLLDWSHIILITDLDSDAGAKQLGYILELHKKYPGIEVLLLHNGESSATSTSLSTRLYSARKGRDLDPAAAATALASGKDESGSDSAAASTYWNSVRSLVREIGIGANENGMVVNCRMLGPVPSSTVIDTQSLEQLHVYERSNRIGVLAKKAFELGLESQIPDPLSLANLQASIELSASSDVPEGQNDSGPNLRTNEFEKWKSTHSAISVSNSDDPSIYIVAAVDPTSQIAQRWAPILKVLSELSGVSLKLFLNPRREIKELPIKRFYRHVLEAAPSFNKDGSIARPQAVFHGIPGDALLNLGMDVPHSWLVAPKDSIHDLDNLKLSSLKDGTSVDAIYELEHILIEGHSRDVTLNTAPKGVQLLLGTEKNPHFADTIVMENLGYFQFKAQPGCWKITLKPGQSERIFHLDSVGGQGYTPTPGDENNDVALLSFQGKTLFPRLSRRPGHENDDVLDTGHKPSSAKDYLSKGLGFASGILHSMTGSPKETHADINIFSVASGHLYERMLNIMMVSVMKHTKHSVKFWFIEQFLSPSFKSFLPHLAAEYGFSYEMVTYKWPPWLRAQTEKQRIIWGYKILFLDVLFPLSLDKVIFVDADQIVRTDMYELVTFDLEGAPYGFTPMCDSRTSMEGFRFWKEGYWKKFLRGLPYHISALYVVDLNRFRAIAAGDKLRGQYHTLSADPGSLSNLDQDLPNNMQWVLPIKSLPQDWLWCETWCSDESLKTAKTIDLCNNPLTKEPKLDRARRQVPEWTVYDEEIAAVQRRVLKKEEMIKEDEGRDDEEVPSHEGGEDRKGSGKKQLKKDEL
ncbi:hypothetical protein AJ78_07973 [Emergomyces pasteurianus Ep9510]|uniref:UDP-glucose:glycoprotein glucosyltransferase n=1 Tax=Emergomyces pasteurianus Ep9510 TaxID=1447872 RepID=A0A1J9P4B7_9EURO|nr:hypothetical protein AJ78_07973 [Emergomyces pasteurianus Ep9510]